MIVNQYSERIADQALDSVESAPARWPGTTFNPNTEPGQALLGSPNGYGVGFLLGTHRIFSPSTCTSITVFNDEYDDLGFLFALGDPNNPPAPPPPPAPPARKKRAGIAVEELTLDTLSTSAIKETKTSRTWDNDTLSASSGSDLSSYYDSSWEYGGAEMEEEDDD